MLFQLTAIQEIEFLLYLTAIILGFQLAIYFFYRYFKIRDERLPLNKIILSFGFFYSLLIAGAFILAINRFLISDPILKEIIYKIGYIPILLSPVAFLYFIEIEEFSRIINLKIGKLLMIISLIPVVIMIIFPVSLFFIILPVIGITLLGVIFILVFQIRLIGITKGNIRNRLIQIFLGDILIIGSLIFVLEITTSFFPSGIINILFFIGISLMISGLLFTSFGVYGFPAFYEFRWRDNLLRLFIINRKNNTVVYSRDFSQIRDEAYEKDYKKLFSGGITGIDSMLSAITDTEGEKINKIKQADSLILLEYGSDYASQITYSLVVREDLKSNRYFLRSIKNQFESFYKEILTGLDLLKGSEEQLFGSFDILLKNILKGY